MIRPISSPARSRRPLAAAALLACLAATACRDAPDASRSGDWSGPAGFPRSARAEPPALAPSRRWNLLVITLDTVRADVMKGLGARRLVAPNLEQLAAEGVLWTAAETVTPLTLPAHCSLMTGLHPGAHGVRHNARYALGSEHVTLASLLRGAGYDTAAFIASFPLSPEYGLDQGFDVYDATFERTRGVGSERPASAVNAVALPWLRHPREVPFFAWIHYFDAHDPYVPPEPWRSRFPGEPYLGEVALVDHAVGEILAALADAGTLEETLVVIASDHGEGLGEHGETYHGLLLHGATMKVPVIFRGGPLRREARTLDFATSLVDVMPTTLALLGIPGPPAMQGLDLSAALQGRGGDPAREGALSESWYGYLEFGWSPLRAWREPRHRYVEAPTPELYDLRKDPGELANIASSDAKRAARLRAKLLHEEMATSRAGASASASQPMSQQEIEALQALGYVASGGGVALDAAHMPVGPDPKDMMGALAKYESARARLEGGDPAGALPLFDEVIAADPRNLQFRGKRAKALAYLGRVAEAESEWRSMIAQDPRHVLAYWDLAILLDLAGQTRGAIAVMHDMAKADPEYVGLTERLAELLARAGGTDQAIALLTSREEPGAAARAGGRAALAARLALRNGDASQAVALFRKALEASPPAQVPGWLLRAAELEAGGQGGESLLSLKTQAESHPREVAGWSELCHAALRQGANDLAAAACPQLVQIPGHEPQDQEAVLRALLRKQRLDEARQLTSAVLQANPGWWWMHRAWAEELARQGDVAGARAHYEAWAALDPESPAARAGLERPSRR